MWNQCSAKPHPSPCCWDWSIQALLYGNHIFLPLQWSVHGNFSTRCWDGFILPKALSSFWGCFLIASASWNHHSWGLRWGFLYFHAHLTPRCHQKKLINSEAIKTCNLSPALPCYTFPFFAFIPVIASNQISINCQILRELGWVFSKWCQGCGNHFVAAWCCLRRFPGMEDANAGAVFEELREGSDQRCCLWAALI